MIVVPVKVKESFGVNMGDYRVDIRVRNNVFLHRLEKAGYKSIGELCRVHGKMSYASKIGSIVNMTKSPFLSSGDWHFTIKWVAEKLNCAPEDLFTEAQVNTVLKTNRHHVNVQEAEIEWEIKFISDIEHRSHNLTTMQLAKLEQLWERIS